MLALLGIATIVVLLAAIMSGRVTPLVALIVVPVVASFAGGFGLATGKFVTTGVQNIAPVVGMFVFAILFFGIVTDAGMFDPASLAMVRSFAAKAATIGTGSAPDASACRSRMSASPRRPAIAASATLNALVSMRPP